MCKLTLLTARAARLRTDRNHPLCRLDPSHGTLPLVEGPPTGLGGLDAARELDPRLPHEWTRRRFLGLDGDVRLTAERLLEEADLQALDERGHEDEGGNPDGDARENQQGLCSALAQESPCELKREH